MLKQSKIPPSTIIVSGKPSIIFDIPPTNSVGITNDKFPELLSSNESLTNKKKRKKGMRKLWSSRKKLERKHPPTSGAASFPTPRNSSRQNSKKNFNYYNAQIKDSESELQSLSSESEESLKSLTEDEVEVEDFNHKCKPFSVLKPPISNLLRISSTISDSSQISEENFSIARKSHDASVHIIAESSQETKSNPEIIPHNKRKPPQKNDSSINSIEICQSIHNIDPSKLRFSTLNQAKEWILTNFSHKCYPSQDKPCCYDCLEHYDCPVKYIIIQNTTSFVATSYYYELQIINEHTPNKIPLIMYELPTLFLQDLDMLIQNNPQLSSSDLLAILFYQYEYHDDLYPAYYLQLLMDCVGNQGLINLVLTKIQERIEFNLKINPFNSQSQKTRYEIQRKQIFNHILSKELILSIVFPKNSVSNQNNPMEISKNSVSNQNNPMEISQNSVTNQINPMEISKNTVSDALDPVEISTNLSQIEDTNNKRCEIELSFEKSTQTTIQLLKEYKNNMTQTDKEYILMEIDSYHNDELELNITEDKASDHENEEVKEECIHFIDEMNSSMDTTPINLLHTQDEMTSIQSLNLHNDKQSIETEKNILVASSEPQTVNSNLPNISDNINSTNLMPSTPLSSSIIIPSGSQPLLHQTHQLSSDPINFLYLVTNIVARFSERTNNFIKRIDSDNTLMNPNEPTQELCFTNRKEISSWIKSNLKEKYFANNCYNTHRYYCISHIDCVFYYQVQSNFTLKYYGKHTDNLISPKYLHKSKEFLTMIDTQLVNIKCKLNGILPQLICKYQQNNAFLQVLYYNICTLGLYYRFNNFISDRKILLRKKMCLSKPQPQPQVIDEDVLLSNQTTNAISNQSNNHEILLSNYPNCYCNPTTKQPLIFTSISQIKQYLIQHEGIYLYKNHNFCCHNHINCGFQYNLQRITNNQWLIIQNQPLQSHSIQQMFELSTSLLQELYQIYEENMHRPFIKIIRLLKHKLYYLSTSSSFLSTETTSSSSSFGLNQASDCHPLILLSELKLWSMNTSDKIGLQIRFWKYKQSKQTQQTQQMITKNIEKNILYESNRIILENNDEDEDEENMNLNNNSKDIITNIMNKIIKKIEEKQQIISDNMNINPKNTSNNNIPSLSSTLPLNTSSTSSTTSTMMLSFQYYSQQIPILIQKYMTKQESLLLHDNNIIQENQIKSFTNSQEILQYIRTTETQYKYFRYNRVFYCISHINCPYYYRILNDHLLISYGQHNCSEHSLIPKQFQQTTLDFNKKLFQYTEISMYKRYHMLTFLFHQYQKDEEFIQELFYQICNKGKCEHLMQCLSSRIKRKQKKEKELLIEKEKINTSILKDIQQTNQEEEQQEIDVSLVEQSSSLLNDSILSTDLHILTSSSPSASSMLFIDLEQDTNNIKTINEIDILFHQEAMELDL